MTEDHASAEAHPERPLTRAERLAAARARVRSELSLDEAARMQLYLRKELKEWDLNFDDLTRAYHRMLYVIAVMDTSLSVNEIRYLLVTKWNSNTDDASLRKRIALGVEQGELQWRWGDRYSMTPDGVKHLKQVEDRIRAKKEGRPPVRRQSDDRGPKRNFGRDQGRGGQQERDSSRDYGREQGRGGSRERGPARRGGYGRSGGGDRRGSGGRSRP